MMEVLPINQGETQIKFAEDEEFKIIFRVNVVLANIRNLPNMKTSRIIDSYSNGNSGYGKWG